MVFSRRKMLWWVVNACLLAVLVGISLWLTRELWLHSPLSVNRRMAVYQVRSEFPDPKQEQLIVLVIKGSVRATLSYAQTLPDGVNIVGKTGLTPLIVAVLDQDVSMVKALLKAGAHPNGALADLPLTMAMRDPDPTIAKLLLQAGADPNGRPGVSPPLIEAAVMGHMDDIEVLLNAGARVDEPDSFGKTASMVAALSGYYDVTEYLLDHGGSLWVTEKLGMTIPILLDEHSTRPEIIRSQQNLIARYKAAHYPWPPPSPKEVQKLMEDGKWPPKAATVP